MYVRTASAPYRSTYSRGLTALPFEEDIFAPSRVIIPWVKRFVNGSCTPR